MSSTIITRRSALLAAGALALTPTIANAQEPPRLDVPYVPTPQQVVDRMLELAKVTKDDYLIDLGSGDGRIPVTAAKRYGVRAMGVDLNPTRVAEARKNATDNNVTDLVTFEVADLFKTDISKASVLTMYLLSSVNLKLRPRILSEMKPGARIVSHAFDMGDWAPDVTEQVEGRRVMMWTVPPRRA